MSREQTFLKQIGEKLGLEDVTIKKAQEYFRLCSVKSNLDRISDIPKGVICLDLAAKHTGAAFDKATALKLSTSSSSTYGKNYNLIERSLSLNEVLSIPKLCVKLNCCEAIDLAETIMQKFKESNPTHADLDHPQYNAVVVYMACKLKDISATKKQFMQESQLRPMQWKQLEIKFLEFVKKIGLSSEAKNSARKNKDFKETVPRYEIVTEVLEDNDVCEEMEEYGAWKARILSEAYKALKKK